MPPEFLPYYRPDIDADDIAAVTDALAGGWLTTGPKVAEFEAAFAERTGVAVAIGLNSCTAGLHLGLVALDVGPGDDVVLPALSFVAGAQCVRHVGARPVFCDVDPDTLSGSVETISRVVTPATKVIITMPYAGRPVGIGEIVDFAERRGIAVLEDAALAVGTLDRGRWAGTQSRAAVYSFYATKNVTTAEGGMFVTNDQALADRVRVLALHGMDRDAWKRYTIGGTWRYDVASTGFKYNLPDLAAALGIRQLAKLDAMQQRREALARRYVQALGSIEGICPAALGKLGHDDRHSWCMFPILVEPERGLTRDGLIDRLRTEGIGTSVHYIPTHLFSAFSDPRVSLPVTEKAFERLVSLPLYTAMSDADVEDVVAGLKRAIASARLVAS